MFTIPVFGEVHPHILHEFADIAIKPRPLKLVWYDACDVPQCRIEERMSEQILQLLTMRSP